MRGWQLAAFVVAMMTTHVALAAPEALAPAGLDGDADIGGVLGVTAQPGTRLSKRFRLRVGLAQAALPTGPRLVSAAPRPRRVATMLDYYPQEDLGLRVSAGMRLLSKRSRLAWNPYKAAQPDMLIYAPALLGGMPLRNNIAHTAPAMTMGWTSRLSDTAVFGLEAGTLMEHGNGRASAATIANPELRTAAWSRVDPVAQVAFALKF